MANPAAKGPDAHWKVLYSALSCCSTMHIDQAKGIQTSASHLYTWAVALETAGDDGGLGQSHNDPS